MTSINLPVAQLGQNPQLAIVTVPRSGSSLLMLVNILGLGAELCVGHEHPIELHLADLEGQGEHETDHHYAARLYSLNNDPKRARLERMVADSMMMNKKGFWEHRRHIGGGLRYHTKNELPVGGFVKLLAAALAKSDPRYVDKIVYAIRHPRAVAESQKKLKRRGIAEEIIGQIYTPARFIAGHCVAARWIVDHPTVPVHIVNYDDLVDSPKDTIKKLGAFVGRGNWEKAHEMINPKLRRSYRKDGDGEHDDQWHDAELVFSLLRAGDFPGIVQFADDQHTVTRATYDEYYCTRYGRDVVPNMCEGCRDDLGVMHMYRRWAINRGIDFAAEPCVAELGMDRTLTLDQIKTREQSIAENFWLDENAPVNRAYCKHRGEDIIEYVPCTTCAGKGVRLHVFQCAVFGKCTIRRPGGAGVAMCNAPGGGCDSFEAAEID